MKQLSIFDTTRCSSALLLILWIKKRFINQNRYLNQYISFKPVNERIINENFEIGE